MSYPDDMPPPPLRREASVLAEAAAERRRFGYRIRSLFDQIGRAFPAAAEGVLPVIRRFEALPRRRQILLVLSPYLGALALLLFWFGKSSAVELQPNTFESEPIAGVVEVTSLDSEATVVPIATSGPPQAIVQTETDGRTRAAPPTVRSASSETIEPQTPSQPAAEPRLLGRVRTLPRASALFSRPSGTSNRAALLRQGHVLTVFETFPAPDGWVLARSEKGTVGFISTLHLAGKEDPRIEGRKRRKRRRHR